MKTPETSAERFLDARHAGKSGPGRYLAALITCAAVFLLPWFIIAFIVAWTAGTSSTDWIRRGLDADRGTNAYLVHSLPSLLLLLTVVLVLRFVHRRPLHSVVTWRRQVDWPTMAKAFAAWFGLGVAGSLVETLLYPGRYTLSFHTDRFFALLPLALIVVCVTTMGQELFFRGYVLQWSAFLTRRLLPLALLNGLLFMVVQSIGSGSSGGGLGYVDNAVWGILLALTVLKTGGVEVAIGAHAANSVFATLVVGYSGASVTTESIFFAHGGSQVFNLLQLLLSALVLWLLLFRGHRLMRLGEPVGELESAQAGA